MLNPYNAQVVQHHMRRSETEHTMNPSSQPSPGRDGPHSLRRSTSLKRSRSDMQISSPPAKWVNHDHYTKQVLRIPQHTSEDDIDHKLRKNADELGVHTLQLTTNVEAIVSSLSAITIASDPTTQSSILSRSTAPTSCSSSEVRPSVSFMSKADQPLSSKSGVPSILSDMEKKRRSAGFRKGFRRMTGFNKKKKSGNLTSSTLTSISSFPEMDASTNGEAQSAISDMKSPSIISKESSGLWSNRLSTAGESSYEQEPKIDSDALRRSMECTEMISLRAQQLEERQRFLDYQSELVSSIRAHRDVVKSQKGTVHRQLLQEQTDKIDELVEDLESRQLEEELRMLKEHEIEKRTVMVRLRYMEAYCQTPSPPTSPLDSSCIPRIGSSTNLDAARNSVDSMGTTFTPIVIPERKVTDKDYHNLAQQYRERDAMANLHSSKINVLRGRQKRAVENFITRRERDLEKLEIEQHKELDTVDLEFGKQEAECRAEFDTRRRRLEARWRLQAKIERKRRENATGLKFESLPDVICVDNCSVEIMLRPAHKFVELR